MSDVIIGIVCIVGIVGGFALMYGSARQMRDPRNAANDKCHFCLSKRDPEAPNERWSCGTSIGGWDSKLGGGYVVRTRACIDKQEFDDRWNANMRKILSGERL